MDRRIDDRGQMVQIGAVVLFGILIVLFSTYQATVVSNQNTQTEYQHSQEVQSQMATIRNTITAPSEKGQSKTADLALGTSYRSRIIGFNPGTPSGTIRTLGTDDQNIDIEIKNADARKGTPSFWEGTTDFNTGVLRYTPNYNTYQAPETVYEHTALYNNDTSGQTTLADPSMIDGRQINVVLLEGSLIESSSATTSVDITTVDTSQRSLKVSNLGSDPLEIEFSSRKPASYWESIMADGSSGEYIKDISSTDVGNGWYEVRVTLTEDEIYDVTLTKVHLGANPPKPVEDGTKVSMVAYDNVTGTDGFEEWSLHPKPSTDCSPRTTSPYTSRGDDAPFIGGICALGDEVTERTYTLPRGRYEVGFTYWALASWEPGEDGIARWRVDGETIEDWKKEPPSVPGSDRETITVDHPGGEATLQFTSNLDGNGADPVSKDEAFGINDVWIRHTGEYQP